MKTIFLSAIGLLTLSFTANPFASADETAYAIKLSWSANASDESKNCTAALDLEKLVFTANQGCSFHFEIMKGKLHPENKKQMEVFPELLKAHLAKHFSKSIEEIQFKEVVFSGNSDFHSATFTVIVDGKEKVFGISEND